MPSLKFLSMIVLKIMFRNQVFRQTDRQTNRRMDGLTSAHCIISTHALTHIGPR